MTRPIVLFELYPAPLRDLLMYLTGSKIFLARWTNEIHDEWIRNLLENRPDLSRERLERTRRLMDDHVLDCLVTDYEPLIETLRLPDPNDRHVLAAAIQAKASIIVTFNLTDFPKSALEPYGIEAITPDEFVMRLVSENSEKILRLAKRQRENMEHPPKSVEDYLSTLREQRLLKTVTFFQEHRDQL